MKKKIGLIVLSNAKNAKGISEAVFRIVNKIPDTKKGCNEEGIGDLQFGKIVVITPASIDYNDIDHAVCNLHFPTPISVAVLSLNDKPLDDAIDRTIELFSSSGVDYAIIDFDDCVFQNMATIIRAFDEGAKVVGVAHQGLQDIVLRNKLAYTFLCLDVEAFQYANCSNPKEGVSKEKTFFSELIREYGKCIAMFVRSEALSIDDFQRKNSSIETTKDQEEICNLVKSGIMPGYPKAVFYSAHPDTAK